MQITVKRKWFTDRSTISEVIVDGAFECYGLEDRIRAAGTKVKGQTAIPEGTYPLVIDLSQRFGRLMPHVLNVPLFAGIRIHPGNTDKDTEGCLLVGQERGNNAVLNSVRAYLPLFAKIRGAIERGEPVSITYENISPPAELLS